jgi:hypothetical protein
MAVLTQHWKLALLWALSLIAVGAMSSSAQAQRGRPGFNLLTESPVVVFGNDVGFRIERTRDGIPIGRVVIRVDGRWVDTAAPR